MGPVKRKSRFDDGQEDGEVPSSPAKVARTGSTPAAAAAVAAPTALATVTSDEAAKKKKLAAWKEKRAKKLADDASKAAAAAAAAAAVTAPAQPTASAVTASATQAQSSSAPSSSSSSSGGSGGGSDGHAMRMQEGRGAIAFTGLKLNKNRLKPARKGLFVSEQETDMETATATATAGTDPVAGVTEGTAAGGTAVAEAGTKTTKRKSRFSGAPGAAAAAPDGTAGAAEGGGDDPLDAFMTDLYAAGDVAVQSSFTDAAAAAAASAAVDDDGVATLEDILGISSASADAVVDAGAGAGDVSDNAMDVEGTGKGGVDHAAFLAAMRARDDDVEEGEKVGAGGSGENGTATVDAGGSAATSATGTGAGTGTGTGTVVDDGGSGLGLMLQDEGDVMDEKQLATRKAALLAAESRGSSVNKASRAMVGVDHSTIDYAPFRKNLYIVPRALASLSKEAVDARREELTVKVRGQACPAPVDSWDQCGLSERTLQVIAKQGFDAPFAIQCQAMPAIMAGRDVLAVAKTGSGKTMAFLLPMFRHVLDQPPLAHGDGPIGVIIAPARELAVQIHAEARRFARILGMRVACAYGGAGIGEQIAELKRGAEIVVCTPGRLIDILYNSGKVTNMQRTTMVVMDEADRMFDMGFEPQVNLILQNVRPDRQIVLFSATFPRAIEQLARKTLQFPLEVVVGERSVVNKDITQHVEVRATDQHKFLRLLQVLGLWYDKGSTLIFVDKQETCDELFAELSKAGYPTLSLHGGIEQMDRDHTLHEFKTLQKKVMVATSVAGRGLDVPDCACVVNYNCPNHLEDYVHRVGRTGRAGRKGTSFTFVTPEEEAYSPFLKEVLTKAGEAVPTDLQALEDAFNAKVAAGAAVKHKGTVGFKNSKGFSFDPKELSEEQKAAAAAKRAYEVAQGISVAALPEDRVEEEVPAAAAAADTAKDAGAAIVPATTAGGVVIQVAVDAPPTTAVGMAQARARMLASKLAGLTSGGAAAAGLVPPPPSSSSSGGGTRSGTIASVEVEIDINDYSSTARRKTTAKSTVENIFNKTGVNIVARGTYTKDSKETLADQQHLSYDKRRLHLLLQGPGDHEMAAARHTIQAILDTEQGKAAAAAPSSSRYRVVG